MTEETIEIQDQTSKSDNHLWIIPCVVVTAIAAFWRFWDLTLKPLHHDEGVNGYFLINLFRNGDYKYDPSNYHGPTLYYISLAFTKLFGLETFSIRASVAVFGVLMVAMVLCLRKYLGTFGSIVAALLVALSPGMVYISRYFIHEIFFVVCSLGIVLGVLFFIEGRKAGMFATVLMTLLLLVCFVAPPMILANAIGKDNPTLLWILQVGFFAIEAFLVFLVMRMLLSWNEGRPIYLILASASMALFFATKETAFITIGTMLIACACVWVWRKLYVGMFGKIEENELETTKISWGTFLQRFHESDSWLLLVAVAVTFIYVSVVFFSSFFSYWGGVVGAFEAYAFWTKTGTGDHTQNGYLAYVKWLKLTELPILILSAIGTLIALLKGRHLFAMFTGFWAFGLFAAYTIIPYKTPWLALSFILPMCLVAGYGLNEIFKNRDVAIKIFAGLVTLFAVVVLSYQTYDLNFQRYDDDQMPYVYAHTQRGFLDLIKEIEHYAEKSDKGKDSTIEIVSPDYWPMPWYMREYSHANFHGKIVDANASEMIVAKKDEQDDEVSTKYISHYKKAGEYPLRPGVTLVLLVRKDLADSNTTNITPPL
ncbi:MAG TPA: glycosyltransferase family 39 protein [Pyrinomonadaceae bacterium]|nr:glycosyltransferase family 39 protein [Pyrinomonadaceae bacterium]